MDSKIAELSSAHAAVVQLCGTGTDVGRGTTLVELTVTEEVIREDGVSEINELVGFGLG